LDPERVVRARRWVRLADVAERLFVLEGDAAEVLLHLSPSFDLVYLDAAKGQYLANLESLLPLLADGATIIADDIFHDGLLNTPWEAIPRRQRTIVKRLQEFLARLRQPPFYDVRVENTGNGMAIARFRKEIVNDNQ
jgi:predicted O-methyltransferase YrrM